MPQDSEVRVTRDGAIAIVELCRPPANYFDPALLGELAGALNDLSGTEGCRAIVLCSEGKHFCAGSDFSTAAQEGYGSPLSEVYTSAARIFDVEIPIVAAVQGAAVGGGMGLACSADFRVAAPSTRFVPNFVRLGIHHGFGLTVTLPRIIGLQRASELLYAGLPVDAERAARIGLVDQLVTEEAALRDTATALAHQLAEGAPLALRAIRRTLRGDLADQVRRALTAESERQLELFATEDWRRGLAASMARETPTFFGD